MSFDEKQAWIFAAVTACCYAAYVVIVGGRSQHAPLTEIRYAWPLFGSIGAAVATTVMGTILITLLAPKDADTRDERDAAIARHGDVIGYCVLCVGILGALGLTTAEVAHFWIANAIYLAFVIAALIGTAAKLLAYRRGFQPR